jgi:hypothetical protein
MISDQIRGALEPEVGQLGQHGPLARDRVRQHHVEGRQPVGGNDEHVIVVDGIDIADLAAVDELEALQIALIQGFDNYRHGSIILGCGSG